MRERLGHGRHGASDPVLAVGDQEGDIFGGEGLGPAPSGGTGARGFAAAGAIGTAAAGA